MNRSGRREKGFYQMLVERWWIGKIG